MVSSFTKLVLMPAIVVIKKAVAPTEVRLTIANSMTNIFNGVFAQYGEVSQSRREVSVGGK